MRTQKSETETASAVAMPSPFVQGREHESDRREALRDASPTLEKNRLQAEAALAEAEAAAAAAREALRERDTLAEVLRSVLVDERRLVSDIAYWRERPGALEAQVAEIESILVDCSARFSQGDNQVRWARAIERLVVVREELNQARRVLPAVEAAFEAVCASRAELQVRLGFEVRRVMADGRLEGAPPEPEPARQEWKWDSGAGAVRLTNVEAR